jgi:cardiolipin synthase
MPPAESSAWLTIPNGLTLLRLLLIIPFVTLAAGGQDLAALGVFVAAGVTDVLDGAVARRWSQGSKWGRLFDPLADKLLTGAAYVTLALRPGLSAIPLWVMTAVLLRDAAILSGSLAIYAARRKAGFKPTLFGKMNTLIELGVVTWFLASTGTASLAAALPALYGVLLFSLVLSLADYLRIGLRMLRS